MKTYYIPLYNWLTMTDSLITVIKDLINAVSGQGLNDYLKVTYSNHLNCEKWNNHQRYESSAPRGQFLGYPQLSRAVRFLS